MPSEHGRGVVEQAIEIVKRDRTSTWEQLLRKRDPSIRNWGATPQRTKVERHGYAKRS